MADDQLRHLSVDGLRSLDALVSDTSSLIHANRAGFLLPLVRTVRLVAPPGVLDELGDRVADRATVLLIEHIPEDEALYRDYRADAQVVIAARQSGLPVLSDDLRLLARAAQHDIAGYTIRVMLELLLMRRVIDLESYTRFKRSLSGLVRYAVPLWVAAEELHWQIRKEETG